MTSRLPMPVWGRGPYGLLKKRTASVLQGALEEEMTEHLDHEKPPRFCLCPGQ